jgi:hypothetical protein
MRIDDIKALHWFSSAKKVYNLRMAASLPYVVDRIYI